MNITVKDTGPCKKLIDVSVPYEEMKDDINRIKQMLQQKATIPGFRAGKVPWSMLEQHYGSTIDSEIKNQVVQSVYQKVLEEKELHPVAPPVVNKVEYEKNSKLIFQMEVETIPKIELPKYKGIEIKKKCIEITEKHIEEELKHLQEQHAQFEVVENRPVAMGDFVIVDYDIIPTGKKEVLDQAKQVWVEIKEDFFIPKFCTQLIGLEKGQEKDIKVTLPKEYPKPTLSGKKVIIHVKVNELKKKILPELNDDFVKEMGHVNSLNELKDKIKEQLEAYTKRMIEKDTVSQIEEYLLNNTKLDVPPTIVGKFDNAIYQDTVSYLKGSGRADDDVIKEKESEIRTDSRKKAVDQVKLLYIMEEIADKEKVEITDSELEDHIKEVVKQSNKPEKEVREYLNKDNRLWNFKHKLRNEKLIKILLDKAKIEEVEASSK